MSRSSGEVHALLLRDLPVIKVAGHCPSFCDGGFPITHTCLRWRGHSGEHVCTCGHEWQDTPDASPPECAP